jgi:hypothetical protein
MKSFYKEISLSPFAGEEMIGSSHLLATAGTLRKYLQTPEVVQGKFNSQIENTRIVAQSGSRWYMSAEEIGLRLKHLIEEGVLSGIDTSTLGSVSVLLCDVFITVHTLSQMDYKNRMLYILLCICRGKAASMVAQSGMLDEGSELWKILNMKDVFNTVEKVLSDENTTISEEIVAQLFKFIDFITILPELNWSSWDQIPVHLENRWKGLDLEFPRNPYHFLLIVVRNLMSYAKDGWQLLVNKDINISRLSYRSQLKTHIMKINEVYHNHKDEDPTTLIRIHDEWYSFRDNYKICVKTDPVLGRTDKKVDTMYTYARSILTGTGARPMPLGVFLNGPAGVGKSFMSDLIIRALHEDMMPDTKYSQKLVCTRNSEKFMTNLTHLTRYIKLDDFNAMHSTSANPDPTILDILQIQNTTKVASVQAAVENKGQIYFNNLLTVATGNNALRGVDKVYKCVSAIGRRFHIVVQVEAIEGEDLKPIFANRPELGLEQAVIYIGKFSNQPGKLGEVDFDKKNPLSIKEFIAYVRSEYAKYKDSSQTHTKLVSALEELDFDFNKMEAREPQYIAESAISPLILLPLWISFIGLILRIWYWLSPLWCRKTMINICTQQHFIMRVVVRYQLYKYFEVPLSYLIQEEARSQIQSFRPPRLAQILIICTTIFGILKMASQLGRTTNFAQGNTTSLPQKAWDTTKNSRDIVNKRIGNNPQVATRKKLSRNLLKFDVTSFDNSGNRIKCIRGICFLVKGRYALFPKHYLAGGNSFSLRWKRIDSTEKLVESGKIEFNLDYPQIHPDYDLASVKLNCQPGKDIEMHLPTQSAQRVQEAIEGKVAKLWTFNESQLVVLDGKPSTGISACNIPYKDVSGEHTFTNLVMCKHTFESYSGMCGSLIVIDNTIVGMHVAGAEGMSMGLFIVLGKDVVDTLVPEAYVAHGNEFYELPFPDQWELSELHERSRYNFIHGGIARVHGTFKHHQSSVKSKLVRMPTAEKVESFTGFRFEKPIFKRQQTWESDPFRNNLLHVFGENPTIPRDIFNLAVEMYRNRIVKLSSEVKPLTLHQAINGIDGSKSIHRINMRTSTGYPYFTPKKEMLVPIYVDGKSTDDWALPNTLQVQYDVIVDQYKKGCTVSPIFKGSLKDEATAAEKVREGKLRLFSCAPMAWCLVVRQYFLPLIELLRDTEESEMAVGINHRSSRWGTYAKQLTKFGPTRIVAGDYSKYDKYMDSLDIEVGLGVLIDFAKECGYDDNSIIIMKSCITDISLPCLMVNNDLCTVQGTNPSGQPITVELNCILNSIYMRCVWVKLSREHSTDLKFDDHISLITYGDDNVMSCSWDNFNNYSVQKVLLDWGIKYTSPDKKEFEAPYYNIEEVEFLKRKFRLENIEGEAIWVAPLSFKSIYKPLIWTMGDLCIESHIKDMILCAFDELCIHPPGEWDHHGSFLMKLFQAYACNYDFHEFKISRENLLVKLYGELPEASFEDQQPDKDVYNNVNKEFNEECHRRMTHSMQGTEIPYSSGKLNFPTSNEGLGVETKPIQFLAQSEEIDPTDDSPTNEVQGIVTFTDGGPVVGPSLEDERNVARLKGHDNASLSNFLSRPVIVDQATWTHGSGVSLDLDVYNLLLTNPAINKKIANFGLFRADLVIRMQVNATNFHYGALQVYWEPLPTLRVRELAESLQSVSQRPLQFVLNPSDSKTLEFKIPFVYHKDYIVLDGYPGSEQVGALKTLNWRNLGTSNGVVSNATITTQAYFENVDMVIPTAQGEIIYEAQGKQKRSSKNKSNDKDDSVDKPVEEELDEIREEETKEEGLISSISSATASALGMFRDIPVIGRFAMQGKNFMEKVSKTAHLWGLSRPHQQLAIKYLDLQRRAEWLIPRELIQLPCWHWIPSAQHHSQVDVLRPIPRIRWLFQPYFLDGPLLLVLTGILLILLIQNLWISQYTQEFSLVQDQQSTPHQWGTQVCLSNTGEVRLNTNSSLSNLRTIQDVCAFNSPQQDSGLQQLHKARCTPRFLISRKVRRLSFESTGLKVKSIRNCLYRLCLRCMIP